MWILQFLSTFLTEVKGLPLNWFLSAVVIYLLYVRLTSRPPPTVPSCHPETVLFRDYTPRELVAFDGRQDGGNGKIYIAVNKRVFDVTSGRNFYGPDGPYGNFAGRDASRGLAINSFDKSVLTDLDRPIDPLNNLSGEEKESLRDWFTHFASKYDHVGTLVNESSTKE